MLTVGIDGAWKGLGWGIWEEKRKDWKAVGWAGLGTRKARQTALAAYLDLTILPHLVAILPTREEIQERWANPRKRWPAPPMVLVIEDLYTQVHQSVSQGDLLALVQEVDRGADFVRMRAILDRNRPKWNVALTNHRLGTCVGSVGMWGVQHGMPEPVWHSPDVWRKFWSIRGRNREEKKERAIKLVRGLWPGVVPGHLSDDAVGDVSEAMLLTAFEAQNNRG